MVRLAINLHKVSRIQNFMFPFMLLLTLFLGYMFFSWIYYFSAFFGILTATNWYFMYGQNEHALLKNFGLLASMRYMIESIGPEMRQYLYLEDNEERPFNRHERSEVYRKAKDIDSAAAFGSQLNFSGDEIKIKHSMYPLSKDRVEEFSLTFGEERNLKTAYTINKPFMISAMSFGALGENAVRSLSRGAKMSGIPINCGEGGFPKYHLKERADIIFQLGTAKFGCRNEDNSLNDEKLKKITSLPEVKMVEIKISQGAKPGKGGLLPKSKISPEIAKLRGVKRDRDVVSPPHHVECKDPKTTVEFISRVQKISGLPVGIKICIGDFGEFRDLVLMMKKMKTFPDYIVIDGAEGGTGAAPKGFIDNVGVPLYSALYRVDEILRELKVRDKLKVVASGKLIIPGKQMTAMCLGADAIYSARGFMFSIGCIQALQCGGNTCPVGITTHDPTLQKGLVVSEKASRVANYVKNMEKDFYELLAATGVKSPRDLSRKNLFIPQGSNVGKSM